MKPNQTRHQTRTPPRILRRQADPFWLASQSLSISSLSAAAPFNTITTAGSDPEGAKQRNRAPSKSANGRARPPPPLAAPAVAASTNGGRRVAISTPRHPAAPPNPTDVIPPTAPPPPWPNASLRSPSPKRCPNSATTSASPLKTPASAKPRPRRSRGGESPPHRDIVITQP